MVALYILISFGKSLPEQAWQMATEQAMMCDVFISIDTSSLVYPAAGLAELAKQHNHATIIEINPNPIQNPIVDIQINQKAGEALPQLVQQILRIS